MPPRQSSPDQPLATVRSAIGALVALILHLAPSHAAQPRPQTGETSVYSTRFEGRRTASGERFRAESDIAASKTLPIGTTARVVNLKTGRTAVARIMDHGPQVRGRILDISPATARELGMLHTGLAWVRGEPLEEAPKTRFGG